jgi:two-component system chemotaxis response regulator CheY
MTGALRKVLVVDDSVLIHRMCALFLSRYPGTQLVTATDGSAALDVLGREPEIDLVLLDINMPVMNGLELLQRLQSEAAYQTVPVIVISTQGREEDAERCLRLGARGYLRKPFKSPELHDAIEKATGVRHP